MDIETQRKRPASPSSPSPVTLKRAPNASDALERRKKQTVTPKKAFTASEALERKKQKIASAFVPEKLTVSPFRAGCIKAAELEAYTKHPNSDHNEKEVKRDVFRSVQEENRKHDQAKLATIVARNTAQRLLGHKNTETEGDLESEMELELEKKFGKLVRFGVVFFPDEMTKIRKLTGVTIFPKVDGQGGDIAIGTLEAHDEEFIYTTFSSHFRLHFTYKSVKEAFFQVKDGKNMPTLLHFHLHHAILLGTEERKDIQFRLGPAAVGHRTSENDSDNFEKEKPTKDRGRNEDLKNFVDKVELKWQGSPSPFSFQEVHNRVEFNGVLLSEASAGFIMTFSSLIRLSDTPFVVVESEDIEIVNLARLRPGEIDMTIVFTDFKCDVLQIRSIPLDSLNGMKKILNFWGVKFYENDLHVDWNSILNEISDFPEKFIQKGGWDAFKLEDNATSLYYRHYYLEEAQVVCDKDYV